MASLVETPGAVDAADGPEDTVVDVDVGNVVGVLADIEDRVGVGAVEPGEEVRLRAGIEVMDVVEAEEQRRRRIRQLIVTHLRGGADDVVGGTLEAERGGTLEQDGGSPFHAGGVTSRVGDPVVGPLVQVAGNLQGALVDEHDAGEGRLRAQVVRHRGRGGRRELEGVVREVVEVAEGVVLQGRTARLHDGLEPGEVAGVDGGRVAGAHQLRGGGGVDELVDRQGRGGGDGEGVDRLQALLNGGRLREQARSAEVGNDHVGAGQHDVGGGGGLVLDGHVGLDRRDGGAKGDRGEDQELAGEFHAKGLG